MTLIPPNQSRPVTVADITAKLREFFVLADEGVVELVLGGFIANRLPTVHAPVWIMLVAESSGGKTEIIDMFSKLSDDKYKLAYHISDLSPQTFISGAQNGGAETSLLQRINGRMVFIKDFTTILQKNKEARREILSQFREIYDGAFNKDFGTGKSVHWKGRIGVIAGLTPPALEMMGQYAGMGERFINYFLKQPSDAQLAQAMKDNYNKDIKKIKDELSTMVAQYVETHVLMAEEMTEDQQKLSDELLDELNEVAIFATRARSPIMLDFKTGEPIGMPSIERFPRFVIQLQSLAKSFVLMNGGVQVLTQVQKDILYKIALDSIPRTRRAVLTILASHRAVSTSAAAARLGFTTPIMRGYLAQLSSLTLAQRIPKGGTGQEDAWKLLPVHQKFMERFEKIKKSEEDMFDEDEVELMDTLSTSDEERLQMQYDKKRGEEQSEIAKLQKDKNLATYAEAEELYHKKKAEDPEYDVEMDF